jgi:hypothetical protein
VKELILSIIMASGTFSANINWTTNDLGDDVLGGKIAFTAKQCSKYELIQAARVLDNQGQDLVWKMGEQKRNEIKSQNGYFIDHLSFKCQKGKPCSPLYRDHWPSGGQAGSKTHAAKLEDYPFGWSEFSKITLETCAWCSETKTVLGCITWGGEFPLIGSKTITPVHHSSTPSKDFVEALDKFHKFYK